jgi:hypothetical protein
LLCAEADVLVVSKQSRLRRHLKNHQHCPRASTSPKLELITPTAANLNVCFAPKAVIRIPLEKTNLAFSTEES